MAFVAIGIKLPHHITRALSTAFFGVAGFLIAWWALMDAVAGYEAFLLGLLLAGIEGGAEKG